MHEYIDSLGGKAAGAPDIETDAEEEVLGPVVLGAGIIVALLTPHYARLK